MEQEQIMKNYEKLIDIVKKDFTGERLSCIEELYSHFDERIAICPASSKKNTHGSYPGGYVENTLKLYELAFKIKEILMSLGRTMDFTDEELSFVILHQHLGKIGNMSEDYYIVSENEWRRKNLGELYSFNDRIAYMTIPDRSLYLLQQFGVTLSENEYISIKLCNGLYDKGNESYLISYDGKKEIQSLLPYIIQTSNVIISKLDSNSSVLKMDDKKVIIKNRNKKITTDTISNTVSAEDIQNVFDDLFK